MTIQSVYGSAAKCNLCPNTGPLVRYDGQRYTIAGHEDYTESIKAKALSMALDEGFITIPRPIPAPNGVRYNDQHICPACQAEMKFLKASRKKVRKVCKKKIW